MEENIHMILCKLLCIFPYAFFDSMPHLPIHLPYEARIGGEYHCKHPFERYSILYHLLLYNVPINWYCIFYLGFKIKLKELWRTRNAWKGLYVKHICGKRHHTSLLIILCLLFVRMRNFIKTIYNQFYPSLNLLDKQLVYTMKRDLMIKNYWQPNCFSLEP